MFLDGQVRQKRLKSPSTSLAGCWCWWNSISDLAILASLNLTLPHGERGLWGLILLPIDAG
jgi:hypothetical protein